LFSRFFAADRDMLRELAGNLSLRPVANLGDVRPNAAILIREFELKTQ
jgi:hypothetical protein